MAKTYRIAGPSLGASSKLFVDCEVTDVSVDPTEVTLTEVGVTDARSWTVPVADFEGWLAADSAARHSELTDPTNPVWTALQTVYQARDTEFVADLEADLGSTVIGLFREIVAADTN